MEVFYITENGTRVRSVAYLSYRRELTGEWMVGERRLRDLKQISADEWFNTRWGAEWAASARAMIQ